jgi:polar amino acid transport system substrate-binding protein
MVDAQQSPDPRVADLVRAGRIRLGLFLPLYARDPATGELRGVGSVGVLAHEIARAVASRLGVEVQLIGHPTPPKLLESLNAGACDMAVMGIESSRVTEVDFSPPVVQFDYTYLVPPGSSIRLTTDADRRGVRIAVVRNHASTLALTRILKQAKLVYAETPEPAFDLLRTGQADAMASARRILMGYSRELPGSRFLEDRYGVNLVGIAVPKSQPQRLSYLSEFIEEAKGSGFIRRIIEQVGALELEVAPAGIANEVKS